MTRDPIVEEIRRIREAHAAEFNYSISAIIEDLVRKQNPNKYKYVSLPPKRIKQTTPGSDS